MAGHACVNRSLKIAPASVVAPYQYTLIVWAIVLGYLFFGDVGRILDAGRRGVICGAGLALLLLEREAARRGREAKDIETPILPGGVIATSQLCVIFAADGPRVELDSEPRARRQ